MCNPVAFMAVSSMMTVASGVQQARAQSKQGKYQEKIGKQNALIQHRIAEDAMQRGDIQEAKIRTRTAQQISSQKAQFASSGLRMDVGNPVDILADTAEFGELDALTAKNNAQREAFGHQVNETNSLNQARLDRLRGDSNARSTLLNTATSVSSQWASFGGFNNSAGAPAGSVNTNGWMSSPDPARVSF